MPYIDSSYYDEKFVIILLCKSTKKVNTLFSSAVFVYLLYRMID